MMNRKKFLRNTIAIPFAANSLLSQFSFLNSPPFHRVRPTDPGWPSESSWNELKTQVGGRLIRPRSPLDDCRNGTGIPCDNVFKSLTNPYYIGDEVALTQTLGWLDAWTTATSVYAVAAANTNDVVAAVNFAMKNNLRLVVKGGGHSYQGTSNAPDSLLIWTRAMNAITLHEAFAPRGCNVAPQPAVSVGAGSMWMHVYDEVTTKGGRYVQGGGCATVGVAGLVQSGGFGSFSKHYGTAASGLLEAEVVTADGKVRIANACSNPDLFWGIKGGGGGSLGVVTRLTLRTRELPAFFGGVFGSVKAQTDEAYKELLQYVISFYHDKLFNSHWGEQIRFHTDNSVSFSMVFQGLTQTEAAGVWQPFMDWVKSHGDKYRMDAPLQVLALPAQHLWDGEFLKKFAPGLIGSDDRADAPGNNIFWKGDQGQAGQFLYAYRSAWLPQSLLSSDRDAFIEALFNASRLWSVSLHFNKGLAGAPAEAIDAARDTATNPAVLDAFALAIIAGGTGPAFPGISHHEPNVAAGHHDAARINQSMDSLLKVVSAPGSYVSESNFFEANWQQSFWGDNYGRLAGVKKKYDRKGLFFVHHGVGSEEWSDDGFTKNR